MKTIFALISVLKCQNEMTFPRVVLSFYTDQSMIPSIGHGGGILF